MCCPKWAWLLTFGSPSSCLKTDQWYCDKTQSQFSLFSTLTQIPINVFFHHVTGESIFALCFFFSPESPTFARDSGLFCSRSSWHTLFCDGHFYMSQASIQCSVFWCVWVSVCVIVQTFDPGMHMHHSYNPKTVQTVFWACQITCNKHSTIETF